MKLLALFALTAIVSAEFTCINPVNPIPAGPPGVCCEDLDQSALLDFVYTGKTCTSLSFFVKIINHHCKTGPQSTNFVYRYSSQ